MNDNLLVYDHEGVRTITLNRPELHNAFDDRMILDFQAVLDDCNKHPAIKLVQLKAHGKSFSAGADLNWMKRMANYSQAENEADAMALAHLLKTLNQLRQPTIAVVQGAAFGGGVGLVACCDIVLASKQASFCLSEVKIGLIPAVISPYVMAAIGESMMRRYALTAESFDALTAFRLRLVHEIVEPNALIERTEKITQQLLANGFYAMVETKRLIHAMNKSLMTPALIEETAKRIAKIRVSEEGQLGLKKFLEKTS